MPCKQKNVIISFDKPLLQEIDGTIKITMNNANSWFDEPGKPMLPACIRIFMFPYGTQIKNVHVTYNFSIEQSLSQPLITGSQSAPLLSHTSHNIYQKNQDTFLSNVIPDKPYQYWLNVGIDDGNSILFVTVKCYPLVYNPAQSLISYSKNAIINIEYEEPTNQPLQEDTFDLVIIAPEKFSDLLQPLVDHKNSYEVKTYIKTCEDIYNEYSGVDKPEQIKYFIKEAYDTQGIQYVLLVGGLNSLIYAQPRDDANQGSKDWLVPVRYTNLYDGGGVQDPGFISDLYYADLYDGYGNFSSWDSNEDGIFAKWISTSDRDILDLYPDVYVGRLACRNKIEVKTMVDKIITYESSPADSSWFDTMVVVGGDTFDDVSSTNYYEGEVENQKSLDYMIGFNPVKIWASHRDTGDLVPIPRDILKTVTKGCGFLAFAGHGSPERWNTYWPEAFDEDRAKGLWWFNIPLFFNRDKLPVCVVGGCHNSQFNITALSFLLDGLWVYSPTPECFSWWLTRKIGGGTIATLGNTGLGYGKVGNSGDLDGDGIDEPDCIEGLGGYLETLFFKAYGMNDTNILGQTWARAITSYLHTYPGMNQKLDCKTVEQWPLLGDPSLKIGGYAN
jgi:hypothetical protein